MQWKYSNFYFQDIVRLSGVGLSVHPKTIHRKLYTWQEMLDLKVKEMRESWAQDESIIYQLIGDNWDKNIWPSYRTSDKGTLSLHLFNVIAVQDRVPFLDKHIRETKDLSKACSFLPSIPQQEQMMKELTFLFATSIVDHNTHLNKVFKSIYPHHLEHEFSHFSGLNTSQVSNTTYNINIVPTLIVMSHSRLDLIWLFAVLKYTYLLLTVSTWPIRL